MYLTKIFTNDFVNIADLKYTHVYDKTTNNCTINENNNYKILPTFLPLIPCGLSFLCLMTLILYTLLKPLIR